LVGERSFKARRGRSRAKVGDLTDKSTSASRPNPGDDADSFRQRALLAAIVDSSDDAIVSKTLEGRILSWNRGATRIFGYEAHEVIGKPITVIIPPELHAEEREILGKLRRGERIDHFDTLRVSKDGRRIPISLTVSPVRDADGTVIAASKVARDISERKLTEHRLQQSEEALRLADRRKDEFLALLAHELRNPLAPIRYALAANRKPGRTLEQCRQAEAIIERQVNHMSRLLDDLLDISRITRGRLELKKTLAELTSIIGAAIETARPLLDEKHHTLVLDLPTQPVQLEADVLRMGQVFSNLLINAAKYTDPGGDIQLRAVLQGAEVVVSVRDNGIGIPADMLPWVFNMFFQSHTAIGRTEGGLGVGLSLVRGLVMLHGGSVEARSPGPGQGSEFITRLPAVSATRETVDAGTEAEPVSADAGLKILLVDDNRDAADTCAMLLEASGHHVQTAYTGRQALELARAFRPHAVLLDIGLPDMDGYSVARQIRATPWGRDTVLVAVTGWGQEQARQDAVEAGFDQHLVKPISAETVETLLHTVARGRQP
jgi:PAS domain S-box-containing protein